MWTSIRNEIQPDAGQTWRSLNVIDALPPIVQSGLRPRLTKYILQKPTVRQRAALLLPHREALYGGAAGGGKTSFLLMAALQYVDIPQYSALIIRKTLKDADNPGSVLFRARQWMSQFPEVRWWPQQNMYVFPSGATLQFGYLAQVNDKYQYDSAEYQYLGMEESTQFFVDDYEYMLSRLRGPACPQHGNQYQRGISDECVDCFNIGPLMQVPLRMRAATNPGGRGHVWHRERFAIREVKGRKGPTGKPLYIGTNPRRPHIPSYIDDNPYINRNDYRESLRLIDDPVTREQKEAGDWGIQNVGRFRRAWVQRFHVQGGGRLLLLGHTIVKVESCFEFLIMDTASSAKNTPGKIQITKKQASHTAIVRFLLTPCNNLLIRHVRRNQGEMPEIISDMKAEIQSGLPPAFVGVEYTTQSIHLFQDLKRKGFNVKAFKPRSLDKIQRSYDAANRMKDGQIWLPQPGPQWLRDFEDEVFAWTGHPEEIDDQVDCLSYAGQYISERATRATPSLPQAIGGRSRY